MLEKRVQIVEIYRDEIRAVIPAGHPLAQRESVTCEDLIPYQLLLPQTGMTRTRLNSWFEEVNGELQISMELDSSETMKRFVMAGLGISFLSASNCRREVESGELKTVPLAPEPMIRKLGLIYRKDKALPKSALGFIQVILKTVRTPRRHEPGRRCCMKMRIRCWIRMRDCRMTCPRCSSRLDDARGVCPECGVNLYHNVSGIVKTSAVMIATGEESGFYDSMQEVPERLRKQLIESTASQNSGTIVIADRAGKEQLTQVLARRESVRRARQRESGSACQRTRSRAGAPQQNRNATRGLHGLPSR